MREGGPVRENPLPRYGAGFFSYQLPTPCGVKAVNISVRRGSAQTGEGMEQIAPCGEKRDLVRRRAIS